MEMKKPEIWHDMLIRYTPVAGTDTLKGEVVLSKEEFMLCYNAWVKENKDG